MTEEFEVDVALVGGGPANLATALYTSRSGIKTAIIEKGVLGGALWNTEDIENYLGFDKVNATDLAEDFIRTGTQFGAETIVGSVRKIEKEDDRFVIQVGRRKQVRAKVAVVATGTSPRMLGLDREKDLVGRGVVTCTTCDGPFYRDKTVVVVGGGDSAFESAAYLSDIAEHVYLLHRSDRFRAKPYLQDIVKGKDNVTIKPFTEVTSIIGENKVEVIDTTQGAVVADGLFLNIGHNPNTDFLEGLGILDDEGYIKTGSKFETAIDGLFAIGDVRSGAVKQVGTAVGEGTALGASLYNYLLEKN